MTDEVQAKRDLRIESDGTPQGTRVIVAGVDVAKHADMVELVMTEGRGIVAVLHFAPQGLETFALASSPAEAEGVEIVEDPIARHNRTKLSG